MIMKEELRKEFEQMAKPLNEWLQKNFSPHAKVIITSDGAEVCEEICGVPFEVLD